MLPSVIILSKVKPVIHNVVASGVSIFETLQQMSDLDCIDVIDFKFGHFEQFNATDLYMNLIT